MTLVIKVLLIRYALIIVEKRDEVYPQKDRRKKKILFFGFEVKTFIFFFFREKEKSHVIKEIGTTFVVII